MRCRFLNIAVKRLLSMLCVLSMAIAMLCSAQAHGVDSLEQFLERHGMHDLLAVHLEDRIERTEPGEERDEIILRLAGIYAMLLEREQEEAGRLAIEERSRRLLSQAPPNSADELRLALLRTSYDRAERIAEQHRLRLASDEQVQQAIGEFDRAVEQLHQLTGYFERSIQTTNARLARASGIEATTLFDRLNKLERMDGSSRYLLAWSLYYRAFLRGERQLGAAEQLFARLLQTESSRPQPEDVPKDLRTFEMTARAMVGIALCNSRSGGGSATALSWLHLLDDEQTHAKVRAEMPAWTLAIRLEHAEFRQALELLRRERAQRDSLPSIWLRMAAAWSLEAERNVAEARGLLQYVIAQLAAAEELQVIHALAEQYGAENLGDSAGNFAVRYVNGLIHYRNARKMQGEADRDRQAVRELYGTAVRELEAALEASDALEHPDAAAACRQLLAWAHYFRGDYLTASRQFEIAAEGASAGDSAEALWMAIVSLDRHLQSHDDADIAAQREGLIDRFLTQHRSSHRAATLLVNRAARAMMLSDSEIARLLAVPPTSSSYVDARRRVSQALYRRYRQASGSERVPAAEAFLGVAGPLLETPEAFGDVEDEAVADQLLAHIRRVLETALHDGVSNRSTALRALARFGEVQALHFDAAQPHEEEVAFRTMQVHLLDDNRARATAIADELWNGEAAGVWGRLASRAVFQHAHRLWKDRGENSHEVLQLIVGYGGRVLRELESVSDRARNVEGQFSYYAAVAEASFALWRDHDVADEGPRSLFLYKRLIERFPSSAPFLHNAAVLAGSEQLAEYKYAAQCWRTLSSGLGRGSAEWFQARYGLLDAMSHTDPVRAREVMDQHRQLYPEYGPYPWGERLRELDQRIGPTPEREAQP